MECVPWELSLTESIQGEVKLNCQKWHIEETQLFEWHSSKITHKSFSAAMTVILMAPKVYIK